MSDNNSYSRIFKGIAVFGGTQLVNILVKIIRGKLVSILLGAKGMGLASLFSSSSNIVVNFSGLGLNASGVRDISEASTIEDEQLRKEKLSIINQCYFMTYILGFILSIAFSPLLSYWTFGDYSYTLTFCVLSIFVVLELCGVHNIAVLQGMGMIKKLAKSTITITITTFVSAMACYYFWGLNGIIPAMLIGAFLNASIRYNQVRQLNIPFKWYPIRDVLKQSKTMMSVGTVSLMSLMMNSIMLYVVNIFIKKFGTIEDIGYYNAANAIILQSVSMLFAAMSADYYPRLAKIAGNREETNMAVNKQTEVLCYIAMPILGLMIVASSLVIYILLSSDFLVITNFVKWIALGTAFKVFSYPLGHVIWAKGDVMILFYLEGIYNSSMRLVVYVLAYYLGGLDGLGYGICAVNAINLIIYSLILYKRYGYVRDSISKKNMLFLLPICAMVLLSIQNNPYLYTIAIIMELFVSVVCLKKLDTKLKLVSNIKSRMFKNNK